MDQIAKLKEIVDGSSNIVFFRRGRGFNGKRDSGFPQRGRAVQSEV